MRSPGRGRRPLGLALSITLALAVLLVAGPATVGGATVSNSWRAKIGSAGVNGTATVQVYTTGAGSLVLKLAKLKASTSLPVTLYKGTCNSVGAVLIKLPAIKTTSGGAATRTSSLSTSQVALIKGATKGIGRIAIRVGSSTTGGVRCGLFAVLAVLPPPPTPTPTPTALPTPTPPFSTLYVESDFLLALPAAWQSVAPNPSTPDRADFTGPGGELLTAHSAGAPGVSLQDATMTVIANIKAATGADPERTDEITMDGVPGILLTHHWVDPRGRIDHLDAFCVRGGRVFELYYSNVAGHEDTDRAFLLALIKNFGFLP